jgi:hypothetical protein
LLNACIDIDIICGVLIGYQIYERRQSLLKMKADFELNNE